MNQPSTAYYLSDVGSIGLARWLNKGGKRRQAMRKAVTDRASGRCELCGEGGLDMHDGRSVFGGTYTLVDPDAPIAAGNIRVVHRGCIPPPADTSIEDDAQ